MTIAAAAAAGGPAMAVTVVTAIHAIRNAINKKYIIYAKIYYLNYWRDFL